MIFAAASGLHSFLNWRKFRAAPLSTQCVEPKWLRIESGFCCKYVGGLKRPPPKKSLRPMQKESPRPMHKKSLRLMNKKGPAANAEKKSLRPVNTKEPATNAQTKSLPQMHKKSLRPMNRKGPAANAGERACGKTPENQNPERNRNHKPSGRQVVVRHRSCVFFCCG